MSVPLERTASSFRSQSAWAPDLPQTRESLAVAEEVSLQQEREMEFESRTPGVGITLTNMGLYLPNGKAILNDVSFTIPVGGTVAVMGPSGSGKSSITNVLSGRAGYGVVTGSIIINNDPEGPTLHSLLNVSGYVPQDDVMHRNLTVFENVLFQAELRLPVEWRQAGNIHWAKDQAL